MFRTLLLLVRGAGRATISTIEGGDVLVIGNGAVLIGMSERAPRRPWRCSAQVSAAGSAPPSFALDMPKSRALMLDTVMTMVDGDTFTQYAGLPMLRSYTIEPGADEAELKVTDHPPEHMHRAIAAALGLSEIRVLTATQDVHAAERERWTTLDVLAVEPGVVVYDHQHPSAEAGGRGDRSRAASWAGAGPAGCMSCRSSATP
ncbi:Arginine deiminase OS=Streptomyces albaduncus OX=68172 GN=arcA PE=3 SV=1 [Streptomyces griseoloalbus]